MGQGREAGRHQGGVLMNIIWFLIIGALVLLFIINLIRKGP
jgi:hypothetical protein